MCTETLTQGPLNLGGLARYVTNPIVEGARVLLAANPCGQRTGIYTALEALFFCFFLQARMDQDHKEKRVARSVGHSLYYAVSCIENSTKHLKVYVYR